MRPEDTVEILEAAARQGEEYSPIWPDGPYVANVDFRISASPGCPEMRLRIGDIFSFDGDEPVDIRQMVQSGMISVYEGEVEIKDGW